MWKPFVHRYINTGGHIFEEIEMTIFFEFFRKCLERSMIRCREDREKKLDLNTCLNILGGRPVENISKAQVNFRTDLQLMCEAAEFPIAILF